MFKRRNKSRCAPSNSLRTDVIDELDKGLDELEEHDDPPYIEPRFDFRLVKDCVEDLLE